MEAIIALVIIIAIIFVIRLFGAWMLRIDEVIANQKAILEELKKEIQKKERINYLGFCYQPITRIAVAN